MEARYLQTELERLLAKEVTRPIFLDSDDLKDLTKLKQHVKDSDVIILVQSTNVLTRPYCIFELVTACEAGVPIVGVNLVGSSYDFAEAASFLTHLDVELELANPGAGAMLTALGVDLTDAAYKLSNTLPQIISIKLDCGASRAVLSATLSDLADTIKAVELPALPSKAEWLAARGARKLPAATGEHGAGAARAASSSLSRGGKSSAGTTSKAKVPKEVPKLPDAYSPRTEVFEAVLAKLLPAEDAASSPSRRGACRKVSARGMGGVGKSILAAAVVRDARVLRAFDKVGFVSIGHRPQMAQLQRALLVQLGGSAPVDADEAALLEALHAAAAGIRLLLVIDDPWEVRHEEGLCCVDEGTGSAVLITTRIRNLVRGAAEVELSVLSRDEAVALLLAAGDVALPKGAPPPPAALEAVELCGRLPLCLSIAGGMVQDHADEWESWLVPALRDSRGGGASLEDEGGSGVEDRVLRASLASIGAKERFGVTAVFNFCAVVPEDVLVPAAVFDALSTEILREEEAVLNAAQAEARARHADESDQRHAGGGVAGAPPSPPASALKVKPVLHKAGSSSFVSPVRRWLRVATDHSLIMGTIGDGLKLHDLVRDFTIARSHARPDGGHAALQKRAIAALLDARPAGGFVDLTTASEDGRKGSELSLYVSNHMGHHYAHGFPPGTPLAPGGVVDPLIVASVDSDETGGSNMLRRHMVRGIGAERLQEAARACEATGQWLDAGRLWVASGAAYTQGDGLREALLGATSALRHVEHLRAARELEATCWELLLFSANTGFKFGSEPVQQLYARVATLTAQGCTAGVMLGMMKEIGQSGLIAHVFKVGCLGSRLQDPSYLRFTPEIADELHDASLQMASQRISFIEQRVPISDMSCNPRLAHDAKVLQFFPSESAADPYELLRTISHLPLVFGYARCASSAKRTAHLEQMYGEGGCKVRRAMGCYDFAQMHPYLTRQSTGDKNVFFGFDGDQFITGAPGAVVALYWGDLTTASQNWMMCSRAWKQLATAVGRGHSDWSVYATAMRCARCCRAVALAMGDYTAVGGLLHNLIEGRAHHSASEHEAYLRVIGRKGVVGTILAAWEGEGEYAGYVWTSVESQCFVARGVSALLEGDARGWADGLDEWLPSTAELLRIAKHEVSWDMTLMGRQHPAVLGAALCVAVERWEQAAALADGALAILAQPLARIEALRLRAVCHVQSGHVAEAAAALRQAIAEAAAARYLLMEALAGAELVRVLQARQPGEAASEEEAEARAALEAVARRMREPRAELRRLLGEDVLAPGAGT